MCGRYTLVRIADLTDLFPWIGEPPPDVPPRYNIAPTQPILAVASDAPDRYDFFFWGLVPPWAKDTSVGARMINARAETLGEKPAFRNAYRRRRCLIPADGFYEWKKPPPGAPKKAPKTPMHVRMKSGKPFALGGIWETWRAPDGSELRSCAIITTAPNDLMASIHDRMPLIVPSSAYRAWLGGQDVPSEQLDALLVAYPGDEMHAGAVSTLVNSPANDTPRCIEPATPPAPPPAAQGGPTLFD